MTLDHYTIRTGHLRRSPRSEVGDEIITMLRPMLTPGSHVIPGFEAYECRTSVHGGTLTGTVAKGPAEIATIYVCTDAAGLADAIETTGAKPTKPLSAPACLVDLHPALALASDASSWLGDFERCLAWAWIEARKEAP